MKKNKMRRCLVRLESADATFHVLKRGVKKRTFSHRNVNVSFPCNLVSQELSSDFSRRHELSCSCRRTKASFGGQKVLTSEGIYHLLGPVDLTPWLPEL